MVLPIGRLATICVQAPRSWFGKNSSAAIMEFPRSGDIDFQRIARWSRINRCQQCPQDHKCHSRTSPESKHFTRLLTVFSAPKYNELRLPVI